MNSEKDIRQRMKEELELQARIEDIMERKDREYQRLRFLFVLALTAIAWMLIGIILYAMVV